MRNTVKNITDLFDEIQAKKADLAKRIAAIKADENTSDKYKAQQIALEIEKASKGFVEVNGRADKAVSELASRTLKRGSFAYDDPRLLAAINFINASKTEIPRAAWEQMLSDLAGKPQEILYLSQLLNEHGDKAAAVAAHEQVKAFEIAESLPQRLSDSIYYACTMDPTADVSFSDYRTELANLVEAAEANSAPSTPEE